MAAISFKYDFDVDMCGLVDERGKNVANCVAEVTFFFISSEEC
jgi:hypothetical protein